MEKAIFDLAYLVAQSESPIAALLWMAFIGCLVWLPSLQNFLLRTRYWQILSPYIIGLGILLIFYLSIAPILSIIFPRVADFKFEPLLHIAALGLVAIWVWLRTLQACREKSKTNAADIIHDFVQSDLIIITRLALWLTLSVDANRQVVLRNKF